MGGAPFTSVEEAAERLRRGGLVAVPTETVYGLAALASDADAVARVFAAKGRPAGNPLIVHVSSVEMARGVVSAWPEEAGALARAFWPGPLTMVLPKADGVPDAVTGGGVTVGVRMPDHPLTLALIERVGALVAPSANVSGGVSPTNAGDARLAMGDPELAVVDGGACERGIESTVVWVAGGEVRVLREGGIGAARLAAVIGRGVVVDRGENEGDPARRGGPPGTALSPGRMERHYAPETRTVLFERGGWSAARAQCAGRCAVVWVGGADGRMDGDIVFELPADAAGYARGLYAALRRADEARCGVILVERPGGEGELWDAVRDRLRRACAR